MKLVEIERRSDSGKNKFMISYRPSVPVVWNTFSITMRRLTGNFIHLNMSNPVKFNECEIFYCSDGKNIEITGKDYNKIQSIKNKLEKELKPKVIDFLRIYTDVHELCVIRNNGYISDIVWIDYEDLCVFTKYGDKIVSEVSWGYLPVITNNRITVQVPCHYIDIE